MVEDKRGPQSQRRVYGRPAFTRGEELLAYAEDWIQKSKEYTLTSFPGNDALGESFGASASTIRRTLIEGGVNEAVNEARKRITLRQLEYRDIWVAASYENILFDINAGTRTRHPSLREFTAEVDIERVTTTQALRKEGLLADFKRRSGAQEKKEASERAATRETSQQQRQRERDSLEEERQRKIREQDDRVYAYVVSSLGAIIVGNQDRLETNIGIGEALGITREEVGASLGRKKLTDFVHDVHIVLSSKGRVARAVGIALAAAKEDPSRGIPKNVDFAESLGVEPMVVSDAIRDAGLREAVAEAREAASKKEIKPSQRNARVLGMLVGNGTIAESNGKPTKISFSSDDPKVIEAFERGGGKLFETPGIRSEQNNLTYVVFNTTAYATTLGKFTRGEAYKLRRKYDWVMNDEYIENFASGIFDAKGSIRMTDNEASLRFYTRTINNAKLYREVLISLGIHDARLEYSSGKLAAVRLGKLKGLKAYAERIRTSSTDKRKKLEYIKGLEPKKRERITISTREEGIDAWIQLVNELEGRRPTSANINERRRGKGNNRTQLTVSFILKMFGDGRTWTSAADELEEIRLSRNKPSQI